MADRQQGLSRTLPKNFTFPSDGLGEPRTPERSSAQRDAPPPPPRHSSYRLRRSRVRSGTDLFAKALYDSSTFNPTVSDIPLPSIEFPPSLDVPAVQPCQTVPHENDRFLAPPRNRVALKTPPAQIRADPIDVQTTGSWSSWDPQNLGDEIQRPGSACSNVSDSSVSSIETYSSRRSVGGSCTSIESDTYDPFFHIEIAPKPTVESSPLPTNPRIKSRARPKERWTLDMDNHLWNTYQLYIQDPTITPFKMTPGSIPPLGVTHRVAREAKRTWERRLRLHKQFPFGASASRSGDSTPTQKSETPKVSWSKSEASTRRRLKLLCKRKFSIAPHYQRMMQSRSPTPFLDLFSRPSNSEPIGESSASSSAVYATRDLGVSLVSSAVPGPLSQLAMQNPSPDMNDRWATQSQPSGPQHETSGRVPTKSSSFDERQVGSRLGSPFTYNTWGPNNSRNKVLRQTPRARRETIHVTGSRLRSPPRMDSLPNMVNNNFTSTSLTTTESPAEQETRRHLEELFRQGKLNDIGQRRVRIRNRGATVSAVNNKGLDQLFSPPSSSRKEETPPVEKPIANPLLNLSGENIKRLGSPFKMEVLKRPQHSPRFIRHAPSLSDPFASGMLPQIRSITQDTIVRDPQLTARFPYDPTEEGISDAERIRRQILNMPHSRR